MSVTEALWTQADNLHAEIQLLQVENTKLHGEQPEEAARVDAEAELAQAHGEREQLAVEARLLQQWLHESQENKVAKAD